MELICEGKLVVVNPLTKRAKKLDDPEGSKWVTIDGTHVCIDVHGHIIKGPAHLVGLTHKPARKPRKPRTGLIPWDGNVPTNIAALKIPPAWTNLHYDPTEGAELLVVGVDEAGRKQRLYSDAHIKEAKVAKFGRFTDLVPQFKLIQKQNAQKAKSADKHDKDTADCMSLIFMTGIRPGSDKENKAKVKAYGATTLEGRHIIKDANGVTLDFIGKKGVHINIPVKDTSVAKMLVKRAKEAGPDGKIFPHTTKDRLLNYSHTLDGGGFKTKDFRTLLGSSLAMDEMAKITAPTDMKSYKKAVKQVAIVVSKALGNTPVVALESYIDPRIFLDWQGGFSTDEQKSE